MADADDIMSASLPAATVVRLQAATSNRTMTHTASSPIVTVTRTGDAISGEGL